MWCVGPKSCGEWWARGDNGGDMDKCCVFHSQEESRFSNMSALSVYFHFHLDEAWRQKGGYLRMGRPREIDGANSNKVQWYFNMKMPRKNVIYLTMKIVYRSICSLHPTAPIPLHQCEDILDKWLQMVFDNPCSSSEKEENHKVTGKSDNSDQNGRWERCCPDCLWLWDWRL